MSRSLHPKAGARYLFERMNREGDGSAAQYRWTVYCPETTFSGAIELRRGGETQLLATDPPAQQPADATQHIDQLVKFARVIARAAIQRETDDLEPWPPRVLRWRGPGRGA